MNGVGKAQKRKGKRLFMPMRILLTGRMQGADVGEQLEALRLDGGGKEVNVEGGKVDYVSLDQRVDKLKEWVATL